MSIVTLVSGGLDSTVMALLTRDAGIEQHPLFIDYGQLNMHRERDACIANFNRHKLPSPKIVYISGYGELLPSGLTSSDKRIYEDAFLPCRNLLFLTIGTGYAYQCSADGVAIGLLDESRSLFPDQTKSFIDESSALLSRSIGRPIRIITPLMAFSKIDVLAVAKELGISRTYSCHAGTKTPCGVCVACREFDGLEV